MLLLLDGHATHFCQANLEFCRQNNIRCVALPPHTSHILQPLDVGIFNVFKAAFRRAVSDPALAEIIPSEASEATKDRMRLIGRSLIAHVSAATPRHIRRAFKKTGIYPSSIGTFLLNSFGVRDIPDAVLEGERARKQSAVAAQVAARINKRRRDTRDDFVIVKRK